VIEKAELPRFSRLSDPFDRGFDASKDVRWRARCVRADSDGDALVATKVLRPLPNARGNDAVHAVDELQCPPETRGRALVLWGGHRRGLSA
jgi:hypothetical protein